MEAGLREQCGVTSLSDTSAPQTALWIDQYTAQLSEWYFRAMVKNADSILSIGWEISESGKRTPCSPFCKGNMLVLSRYNVHLLSWVCRRAANVDTIHLERNTSQEKRNFNLAAALVKKLEDHQSYEDTSSGNKDCLQKFITIHVTAVQIFQSGPTDHALPSDRACR